MGVSNRLAALVFFSAVSICFLPAPASALIDRAFIKDGQVWINQGGNKEPEKLGVDPRPKSDILVSPDHKRLVYFVTDEKPSGIKSSIVELGESGKKLVDHEIRSIDGSAAVPLSIEWITNQQIGVECHENPSSSRYLVISATTGKTTRESLGYKFLWSPDKKTLAHAGWVIHFAPYPHSECLELDDTDVYPKSGPKYGDKQAINHEFLTDFAWSPNSANVALIEELSGGKTGNQLVVISRTSKAVVKKFPLAKMDTYDLKWSKNDEIVVSTGENTRRFHL